MGPTGKRELRGLSLIYRPDLRILALTSFQSESPPRFSFGSSFLDFPNQAILFRFALASDPPETSTGGHVSDEPAARVPTLPQQLLSSLTSPPLVVVICLALQLPICFKVRALSGGLVSSTPE